MVPLFSTLWSEYLFLPSFCKKLLVVEKNQDSHPWKMVYEIIFSFIKICSVLDRMPEDEWVVNRTLAAVTYFLAPWSRVLLEKLTGFQLVKKFPHVMEPEDSLPHSQVPANRPVSEPARSSPYPPHIPLPENSS